MERRSQPRPKKIHFWKHRGGNFVIDKLRHDKLRHGKTSSLFLKMSGKTRSLFSPAKEKHVEKAQKHGQKRKNFVNFLKKVRKNFVTF